MRGEGLVPFLLRYSWDSGGSASTRSQPLGVKSPERRLHPYRRSPTAGGSGASLLDAKSRVRSIGSVPVPEETLPVASRIPICSSEDTDCSTRTTQPCPRRHRVPKLIEWTPVGLLQTIVWLRISLVSFEWHCLIFLFDAHSTWPYFF